MVDSKEVKHLIADLDLVTKTAKVLATKLEKISKKIEIMMSSLDQIETPSTPTTSKAASQPTPVAQSPIKTAEPVISTPKRDSGTVAYDGSNPKVARFLESFISQIQGLSAGKDIAEALSNLRDQVMQSPDVGFHPAFHEMGRYANRIKNLKIISEEEREALIDKIMDWKARLA